MYSIQEYQKTIFTIPKSPNQYSINLIKTQFLHPPFFNLDY